MVSCLADPEPDVPAHTNRLIEEQSPYLQQHAHNPVNWYPWGEEALAKARAENKMLIISIGYAACHWCHVMEEESFEDSLVAAVMNKYFVAIKVDREERPDIDDIYMAACILADNGSCGWPLNAFALPDGRPVWAGTYFPRKNWLEILEYFKNLYRSEPDQLRTYAEQLTEGLGISSRIPPFTGEPQFHGSELDSVAQRMLGHIDLEHGGRRGAPKFPIPNQYEFLLRYHLVTGDSLALRAVEITLDKIAAGGIYDHLEGGFSRYSVDPEWKVPHFEKMLYDNAQLVSLYSQLYRLTGKPRYEEVVRQTLEFLELELSDPEGGFYASLDADNEEGEGAYYLWTETEIDEVLRAPRQAELVREYYQINEQGDLEDGENVLRYRRPLSAVATSIGMELPEAQRLLDDARLRLLEVRKKRPAPGLDHKILTAWNGLILRGLTEAYRTFGDTTYLNRALENARFIEKELIQSDFRLLRHRDAPINGFLDDYAHVIQGLLSLYEVTFDRHWLQLARELTTYALDHFSDSENPLLYYTSEDDKPLAVRRKDLEDNVIPASNSVMARNLFMLGNLYYRPEWVEKSQAMLMSIWSEAVTSEFPDSYSNWCQLYLDQCYSPYEIAIIGPQSGSFRDSLMGDCLPNSWFLGGTTEGDLELLDGKLVEGETLIYVCRNKTCKFPVRDPETARELLAEGMR